MAMKEEELCQDAVDSFAHGLADCANSDNLKAVLAVVVHHDGKVEGQIHGMLSDAEIFQVLGHLEMTKHLLIKPRTEDMQPIMKKI